MAFSIESNDFDDFWRFFYDEVSWISDFFETTEPKILNSEEMEKMSKNG